MALFTLPLGIIAADASVAGCRATNIVIHYHSPSAATAGEEQHGLLDTRWLGVCCCDQILQMFKSKVLITRMK